MARSVTQFDKHFLFHAHHKSNTEAPDNALSVHLRLRGTPKSKYVYSRRVIATRRYSHVGVGTSMFVLGKVVMPKHIAHPSQLFPN